MKRIIMDLCCVMIGLLAVNPALAESRTESVILPKVTVYKGGHCESSAILNALNYALLLSLLRQFGREPETCSKQALLIMSTNYPTRMCSVRISSQY